MDSAHWPQVVVKSKSMEEEEGRRAVLERKAKPPGKDKILNCPRCNSNNTKFCYYNNYSLSQPRYFCKSCRRYWTAGGSLRNIPVGGASRKNKRPAAAANFSSSLLSTSSSSKNNKLNDGDDHQGNPSNNNINASCCLSSDHQNMDQMLMSPRELIPFMPMSPAAADYNTPSSRNISSVFQGEAGEARSLFSTTVEEDFKQLPTIITTDQNQTNGGKLGAVAGFWNGIFGGGSW